MIRRLATALLLLLIGCTGQKPTAPEEPKQDISLGSAHVRTLQRDRPVTAGTPGAIRQAWMVPITDDRNTRFNLIMTANANLPGKLWNDTRFRATVQMDGSNRFPVKLWRLRPDPLTGRMVADRFKMIAAAGCGGPQMNAPQARCTQLTQINGLDTDPELQIDGPRDVLAVEYTPGLLAWHDARCGGICGPFVSQVDNRSNDPVTLYGILGEMR